jgi:flagellar protein FliT
MIMTGQEIVTVYETMSELTAQMLAAASTGDWERLVVLERECAVHVRTLQAANEAGEALAQAQRERKLVAIRKMLADDRKIRDLTTPWMGRLSAMINNTATERRLARAYGG